MLYTVTEKYKFRNKMFTNFCMPMLKQFLTETEDDIQRRFVKIITYKYRTRK